MDYKFGRVKKTKRTCKRSEFHIGYSKSQTGEQNEICLLVRK